MTNLPLATAHVTPQSHAPNAVPPAPDRASERSRTGDTELALFEATEQLLAEQRFSDITVAAVIERAGVSRATFYHYFGSRLGVVTGLLARVMDDMYRASTPFLRQADAESTVDSVRISIARAVALWAGHRAVLQAVMANFAADRELEAHWTHVMTAFAESVSHEIEEERAEGNLPPGPDSRKLAATLVWSTERCLFVAGRGIAASLPDEYAIVDALVTLWVGALQAGDPPVAP